MCDGSGDNHGTDGDDEDDNNLNQAETRTKNKLKRCRMSQTKTITWPLNLQPSPNTLQLVRGRGNDVGIEGSAFKMITTYVKRWQQHVKRLQYACLM